MAARKQKKRQQKTAAKKKKPSRAKATKSTKTPAKKPVKKQARRTKKASAAKKVTPSRPSARERGLTVAAWLQSRPTRVRPTAQQIIDFMAKEAPELVPTIKWGQPIWEHHGPMAWLQTSAAHVSFGFWRGAEMTDDDGVLEGSGSRMRHVKFPAEHSAAEFSAERSAATANLSDDKLRALLQQALQLNASKGDPTKKKKTG